MKSKSIVNLYVVQKGDTIDSIIKKFNMSKEVFYRYNKMTKYVPLVENQPLHIISFYEEQIIEKVTREYLREFPELEGKFSVHICNTADGVNL